MSKPTSKAALKKACRGGSTQLLSLVNSYDEGKRNSEFPKGTMNRNIRDVLAHLHHWHLLFMEWHEIGMQGGKPEMPAKGYTWKNTPELNKVIRKRYSELPLEDVMARFVETNKSVCSIIDKYTDEELFTKKYYKWTGSTSLGSYLTSCTSSHYNWAYKLIKKALQ